MLTCEITCFEDNSPPSSGQLSTSMGIISVAATLQLLVVFAQMQTVAALEDARMGAGVLVPDWYHSLYIAMFVVNAVLFLVAVVEFCLCFLTYRAYARYAGGAGVAVAQNKI
jgi:cbb3-type cytochrome oxidase subunit 1